MALTSLVLHQQPEPCHYTFQTPRGDMGLVSVCKVTVNVQLGHRTDDKVQAWSATFKDHPTAKRVAVQLFDLEALALYLVPDPPVSN